MLLHNCSMNAVLELEWQWWNICRLWWKVLLHVYFAPMVIALVRSFGFIPPGMYDYRHCWVHCDADGRVSKTICASFQFSIMPHPCLHNKRHAEKKRSKVRDFTGFDTWYSTFPSDCAICMSIICVSKGSVFRGDGIGDVRRPLYFRHWACPCSGCSWWGRLDGSRAVSIPRLQGGCGCQQLFLVRCVRWAIRWLHLPDV